MSTESSSVESPQNLQDAQEPVAGLGDYGFLLFLTLLNVMNFVDRQLLGSFANWIMPDLNLSNTEFGLLTGLVFIFFYSFILLWAFSWVLWWICLIARALLQRALRCGVF